jgi:hypothetical protein
MRRLVGRLMSAAGLALMLAGVGVQAGAIALPVGPAQPASTPLASTALSPSTPAASDIAAGPTPSASSVASVAPASEAPTATVPPSASSSAWFDDEFDTQGGWPVGKQDLLKLDYADGAYVVSSATADLPLVVIGLTVASAPELPQTVETDLTFDAGSPASGAAGLVIGDGAGTRLLALVGADGKVGVYRDNIESLDLLASGSITLTGRSVRLAVSLSTDGAIVTVDDQQVARTSNVPAGREFGLAVWSWEAPATVLVERYRISSPG